MQNSKDIISKNKKLFVKIIEKAEKGGYREHLSFLPLFPKSKINFRNLVETILWENMEKIILSHSFAQAFFGKEELPFTMQNHYKIQYKWQYELMYLSLEDNPIQYLKNYL